jgi:hypothetical protein
MTALQEFLDSMSRTMDVTESELSLIERRITPRITAANNNHLSNAALKA